MTLMRDWTGLGELFNRWAVPIQGPTQAPCGLNEPPRLFGMSSHVPSSALTNRAQPTQKPCGGESTWWDSVGVVWASNPQQGHVSQ